jgi:NADH-quinone oxidoreductase subunit G
VLNSRIRKRWLASSMPIGLIGAETDLTYHVTQLGNAPPALAALQNESAEFAKVLRDAKHPMIVVGQGALARPDGAAVLAAAWRLAAAVGALMPEWHGFNVLHTAAARVGALDLGFVPGAEGKDLAQMLDGGVDFLWLLGADEFDVSAIGANTFVVYQGHHGDAGAHRADVILPGAAYTEKPGTYVNTEGRVQRGGLATYPPAEAREDWRILRAFSQVLGRPLPYDDLDALRSRLERVNPVFGRVGFLPRFGCSDQTGPAGDPAALSDEPFRPYIHNYYQTDPISRASPTMAACTAEFVDATLAAAE